MKTKIAVHESTGNVFEDLQIPEAAEALAKAEVAERICTIIARRKFTQAQAGRLLGIDQPKVSALMHGRLGGFSSDRLFRFLNTLGQDVDIVVKPKSRSRKPGQIRVLEKKLAS